MRGARRSALHRSLVAFDNAFVLHVGAASVDDAVRPLRALPGVSYAAPDYAVTSMIAGAPAGPGDRCARSRATTAVARRSAVRRARSRGRDLPPNAAVSLNLQALLNAPGVDAVAAFDEIGARFGQLPGAGEIITNVGLGDADDASAATNPNDPCTRSSRARADDAHHRRPALSRLAVAAADPRLGLGRAPRT